MVSSASFKEGRITMKTLVSALLALSVLAGMAGPSSAWSPKEFWDQVERTAP